MESPCAHVLTVGVATITASDHRVRAVGTTRSATRTGTNVVAARGGRPTAGAQQLAATPSTSCVTSPLALRGARRALGNAAPAAAVPFGRRNRAELGNTIDMRSTTPSSRGRDMGRRCGRLRGRLDPVCRLVCAVRSRSSTTSSSHGASVVFNFADWLRRQGGVVQGLVDFGVDSVNWHSSGWASTIGSILCRCRRFVATRRGRRCKVRSSPSRRSRARRRRPS